MAHTTNNNEEKKYPMNLPETKFPMRGDLAKREPAWVADWVKRDLFNVVRKSRKGARKFILHDGPPYANGPIHMGHALNKVLKDIINKTKLMQGYDVPYVPGWDCHGMPIEVQIEKMYGKGLPREEIITKARAYAKSQVEQQMAGFQRLGVLADWNNPYLTMRHETEAAEIRALAAIVDKGYVYRGLKPVNWCFDCQSALAEAEVEYKDIDGYIIDVEFKLSDADEPVVEKAFTTKLTKPSFAVIWTTTPWTIPANQALNIHPDFEYALVDVGDRYLILAKSLVESSLQRMGLTGSIVATAIGKNLKGVCFWHPLADVDPGYHRFSPVYLATYVDQTSGTGLVHSAPAYGVDDFNVCKANGMTNDDIINPVQGNGVYADWLPLFGGLHIWKAQPVIIDTLKKADRLLHVGHQVHSYPCCWRHKTPLIFRATAQWFVRMDKAGPDTQSALDGHPAHGKTLREAALEGVDRTKFYPAWGYNRLHAMIENRPDWCISRQRNWGVPLPFFLEKDTQKLHPRTLEIMEEVAKRVEKEGIEAWVRAKPEEFLRPDELDHYVKVNDILDVWFDSGTTHYTVMRGSHKDELGYPADLYLEGSDQHRGWFHSSLLTGTMIDGRPPYNALLTHGFLVDQNGEKMSKSKGNVVAPKEIWEKYGAEIIRLWVAMTDYTSELRIGPDILKRTVDSYRRIRNTLRFLLANTSDFDIKKDAVAVDQMVEIDRWAVARADQLQTDVIKFANQNAFHQVTTLLMGFATDDLGSFYLDILKDRLYTSKKDGLARRSAQTALWYITAMYLRLLAPILSFTAEEAFSYFSPNESGTIFTEKNFVLPEVANGEKLLHKWKRIMELRSAVLKKIEELRIAGKVGSSLQAEADITVCGADYEYLASLKDELKFVMMTSRCDLERGAEGSDVRVAVVQTKEKKCVRCWHYVPEVGNDPKYPDLCPRCVINLFGNGEVRRFA